MDVNAYLYRNACRYTYKVTVKTVCRWSQQVPSNCRYLSNKFHGVIYITSRKTIISIFITVRISNLKLPSCLKTILLYKLKYCHKLSTATWRF